MKSPRKIERTLRVLHWLACSAFALWLAALYFQIGPAWLRDEEMRSVILLTAIVLVNILGFAERRFRTTSSPRAGWQPTQAWSGTITVALTGITAVIATGWNARSASDLAIPVIILALTAVLAVLVYRYANHHVAEIGEARFKPSDL
jgi:hypothetical protein